MKPPLPPPAWADRLLVSYCDPLLVEAIQGDLHELHARRAAQYGRLVADLRYGWDVVWFLRPLFRRHTSYERALGPIMWKNYAKIALRNLRKQKVYAFINIFGLAVGLAFCTLIALYVRHEWRYDDFHENAERIVRPHRVTFAPDGSDRATDARLPAPLGPAMVADFPEVEAAVRFWRGDHFVRRSPSHAPVEEEIIFADASLFDVFTFPLVQGDPGTALDGLQNVVLTETAAQRFFGRADPMGKTLSIRVEEDYVDFTVTGVAADVPSHSSIRFEVLLPFAYLTESVAWVQQRRDNWNASAFPVHLLLRTPADRATLATKMQEFRERYYPDEVAEAQADGVWDSDHPIATYRLQPLTDIHLNPDVGPGLFRPSDPFYGYLLGGLALIVLGIACINFMTLAIGRSAGRAREIGVRKVVGARRTQLMGQFWGEALLLAGLSLALGLALAALALPVFNALTTVDLAFTPLQDPGLLLALLGAAAGAGLIAGSYPALVLSGFQPVAVLKNRLRLSGSNALTRTLVVVQFGLSVCLIVGTLVMVQQLDFLRNKNLGYEGRGVVVLPLEGADGKQVLDRLRNDLASDPRFEALTATSISFSRGYSRYGFTYQEVHKEVYEFGVEANYVDFFDLELVAGRNFDPARSTDSTHALLVNEALVADFGWGSPEDAIGQPMTGMTSDPARDPYVIGVVRNYHFRSLTEEVLPMMIELGTRWDRYRYILARLAPGDLPGALDRLQRSWEAAVPNVPFDYSFLDDDLAQQYEADRRWAQILGYGAGFAILIACLGLFGLAALTVTARTKEVGIRKALGATAGGITVLLSKDFARLVVVALVLAAPVAYFAVQRWLGTFAYHIDLGAGVFLLAGGLALAVALLTVSYQALRAALADPVQALRYE